MLIQQPNVHRIEIMSVYFPKKRSWKLLILLISCALFLCLCLDIDGYISDLRRGVITLLGPEYPSPGKMTISRLTLEPGNKNLRNLPVAFWEENRNKSIHNTPSGCPTLPDIFRLQYNNLLWQVLVTPRGTFNFYSSHYDNRTGTPHVRALSMTDRVDPTSRLVCNLWFDAQDAPVQGHVSDVRHIWDQSWGMSDYVIWEPYLVSCRVPDGFRSHVPRAVSFSNNLCEGATTFLRVRHDRPDTRHKVAVCVKGLDFSDQDLSARLVEWMETLLILGAHKVFFYNLHVHPKILRVLEYYEAAGTADWTPLTLPGYQPNEPNLRHDFFRNFVDQKRHDEMIPYNDCLYRNIHSHEYIVNLDVDELIVPLIVYTWQELLQILEKRSIIASAYQARNTYFFEGVDRESHEDIPGYMYMLRNVRRTRKHHDHRSYVKSFMRTDSVFLAHNHFPIMCPGGCINSPIPPSDAQLQHYRGTCVDELRGECVKLKKDTVRDTNLWRFKEELIRRTTVVLTNLGLLSGN